MSILGDVKDIDSLKNLRGKITTIPQTDPTLTKKGYAADAKVVGDYLKEKVSFRDIIDDFTSDDPKKVASAKTVFLLSKQVASINLSEAATVGYNNANSKILILLIKSCL